MARSSELEPQLNSDHTGRIVAAQAGTEQPGRRRCGVVDRPKSRLCLWPAWNSGNDGWQGEIRMVEYVEELTIHTQCKPIIHTEPLCDVEIAPRKVRTTQAVAR
jgi:hypothetical protein